MSYEDQPCALIDYIAGDPNFSETIHEELVGLREWAQSGEAEALYCYGIFLRGVIMNLETPPEDNPEILGLNTGFAQQVGEGLGFVKAAKKGPTLELVTDQYISEMSKNIPTEIVDQAMTLSYGLIEQSATATNEDGTPELDDYLLGEARIMLAGYKIQGLGTDKDVEEAKVWYKAAVPLLDPRDTRRKLFEDEMLVMENTTLDANGPKPPHLKN